MNSQPDSTGRPDSGPGIVIGSPNHSGVAGENIEGTEDASMASVSTAGRVSTIAAEEDAGVSEGELLLGYFGGSAGTHESA